MKQDPATTADVVLIGAGIMSATLGVLLKELDPSLSNVIIERLEEIAAESSDAWNNAGTGHSGFCELNYTPELKDGSIDISKAVKTAESFELSREFWAYLTEQKHIADPKAFINTVPHMNFVWGAENVAYLKKRHKALTKNPLFKGMEFSDNVDQLKEWMPLVMQGRAASKPFAATRMRIGADVNYGSLSRILFNYLCSLDGVTLKLSTEVRDLDQDKDSSWTVSCKDLKTKQKLRTQAKFVFIGAGGGALPLLEKSDIKEAEGYGGFPVSGQWLRCKSERIIAQHNAKVYGKPELGTPPMSVPHLDSRIIDGKKALLFGPYAGFSTKFLKKGSFWDLISSIELDNILPMLSAGFHNIPLTRYLISQATQSPEDRLKALKEYFPEAKLDDWELEIAGQRVQVIKKDKEEGGILEFGTEVVSAADGSLSALLGASPGASTSVYIMLDVLKTCFRSQFNSASWRTKLQEMVPTWGLSLSNNEELCYETRKRTATLLQLEYFENE